MATLESPLDWQLWQITIVRGRFLFTGSRNLFWILKTLLPQSQFQGHLIVGFFAVGANAALSSSRALELTDLLGSPQLHCFVYFPRSLSRSPTRWRDHRPIDLRLSLASLWLH